MTGFPVPGPLRKLRSSVTMTVLPAGNPPVDVAVRVGVRVAERVAVTVRVGVVVPPGPDTSVRKSLATQPIPKLPILTRYHW